MLAWVFLYFVLLYAGFCFPSTSHARDWLERASPKRPILEWDIDLNLLIIHLYDSVDDVLTPWHVLYALYCLSVR